MSSKEEHEHKHMHKHRHKHKHKGQHKNHHSDHDCENKNHCWDKDGKRSKELIKECICNEWSVPHGKTQTVFLSEGFEQIFAAGFVTYDSGNAPHITVRFFDGDDQIGPDLRVFQDSSASFTATEFNRITVSCPNVYDYDEVSWDEDCPEACEGEICIKAKFPVCENDKHSDD